MNDRELEEYLKGMRKFTKKICKSKKKAGKFLQRVGIIDKNGNLTPEYGGEEKSSDVV